jgi:hypothetical protein
MLHATLSRWIALALVLVAGAGTTWASAWAADAAGRVPRPEISVDAATQCIAAPDVMRRTHMDMLKHQRDRTVHLGERGVKVTLNACIDCHAGKGAGAAAGSVVGSPQAFCETCHRYAAVKLDCFDCHQPKPGAAPAAAAAAKQ